MEAWGGTYQSASQEDEMSGERSLAREGTYFVLGQLTPRRELMRYSSEYAPRHPPTCITPLNVCQNASLEAFFVYWMTVETTRDTRDFVSAAKYAGAHTRTSACFLMCGAATCPCPRNGGALTLDSLPARNLKNLRTVSIVAFVPTYGGSEEVQPIFCARLTWSTS